MIEILVYAVFLAVGAVLLFRAVWGLVLAFSSRSWPTTSGVVLVSDLQRSRDSDGGITYRSELAYRYKVEDKELIGSRAKFGDRIELSWSTPAVKIVQKYKAGTEVAVRYDPEDPKEAVLEPGVTLLAWAEVAFGAVFTWLGVVGIVAEL